MSSRRAASGAGVARAIRLLLLCCAVLCGSALPGDVDARSTATRGGPDDLKACPADAPAPVITAGTRAGPAVALTFDADAFNEGTAEILEALAERSARATFFLTGTWMRGNRQLVERMIADGHQVTSHGNTHVDFRDLSDDEIRAQLAAAESELASFGLTGRPYIRLPSDAYDRRVLQVLCSEGFVYISWVLDVRDAVGEPKSAAYVEARMLERLPTQTRAGAIVLLHLGKPGTTEALPRVLDRFREQGFRMRTVRELLEPPPRRPPARAHRHVAL